MYANTPANDECEMSERNECRYHRYLFAPPHSDLALISSRSIKVCPRGINQSTTAQFFETSIAVIISFLGLLFLLFLLLSLTLGLLLCGFTLMALSLLVFGTTLRDH